jgi:hypothetical protein
MRRRAVVGVLAILGLAVLVARADDFWVKKEWKSWTKGDCKKMLEDSPWGKRSLVENNSSNGSLPSAGQGIQNNAQLGNAGVGDITYYTALLSATPVREAVIRQAQLDAKYDKMGDADKKAFDEKMQKQMDAIKPETIVVRVTFEIGKPELLNAISSYWHSLPANTVPMNFYLITEKGAQVAPVNFAWVPGDDNSFDVFFPRNAGSDPIIAPGAKSMKVQFQNPAYGDFPVKNITVEYKMDKMSFDGKPAF